MRNVSQITGIIQVNHAQKLSGPAGNRFLAMVSLHLSQPNLMFLILILDFDTEQYFLLTHSGDVFGTCNVNVNNL